jgi:2-amino-4-hydroxy-6-hydroxymethyldihydropteridine diphosphokinase
VSRSGRSSTVEAQPDGAALTLPRWAVVSDKRRAHIARVVALIEQWAGAMGLPAAERRAWSDAARWHDSLRDAPEDQLRAITGDATGDANLLHGPAAAVQLHRGGERRRDVLDAVRFHTVGSAAWGATGRALYMADFLEPGRSFARGDRAFLARQVPHDFDGTFRQVVRSRLEWTLRDGKQLLPETVALWNTVR